ncbi:RAB6A-GEF complex partner protein 2 isoform X2 [Toxorhynchites rutilus septentrionalis]|uniref:RAB6A-GEF complex partner protein 2 isoform X2 n=1 Tax=Toxorhynchites rutilus septentrionalis TaxID=329112 RepID=UPI0024799C7E|nr:RAB6A-GEF complex partner protein 2 isoform X2 [Toxorhynchites rutilus septentrionalis]
MIEITAKLIRDQSAVFLCGEIVECLIMFTNPSLPEHKFSQCNSDILENLAWATVQIHCYCNSTIQDRVGAGTEATSSINKNVSGSTSLNASNQLKGEVLKSSDPKILFCDLRLSPGESRQFMFRETLPMNTPPTYRGVMVKYYYKITVATQRVGSTVQALYIPIRVLPLPPINCSDETITLNDESNEDLAPNNPFLEKKRAPSKIEYALHYLQNITARRRPNFYLISNKRGKVGRFCLFKPIYKLGEDIVGTLDFSCGTVKCVQLSVTMQCEEIVKKGQESAVNNQDKVGDTLTSVGRITNYTKHHETDLVDVRWRLHFQFVTSTSEELNMEINKETLEWHAPTDISIETMIWNLPVTLYPTSPVQIPQTSGTYTLNIK